MEVYLGWKIFLFFNASLYQINRTIINVIFIALYIPTDSSVGKESTCNAEDPNSIPGSGKSTREGIGYPL